jgi:hypothetical protein
MASDRAQTADVRDRLFTIRMNPEETARLEMLAAHYGLTAAGVVRMLLKREADSVTRATPPAPPAKPATKPRKRK